MHTNSVTVPRVLCLMRSNDTQKLIPRQKFYHSLIPVKML